MEKRRKLREASFFGEKRRKLREASGQVFFGFLCDSTHSNDGNLDRPRSWQPHPNVVLILFSQVSKTNLNYQRSDGRWSTITYRP